MNHLPDNICAREKGKFGSFGFSAGKIWRGLVCGQKQMCQMCVDYLKRAGKKNKKNIQIRIFR
jgi:NAD(P)H-flavin reductase